MNYRHDFHAGNFADVFKHSLLTVLIQQCLKKEKAFCYIDTHAGSGSYDLQSAAAQRTREYRQGINRVLQQPQFPAPLLPYIEMIRACHPENGEGEKLRYYPGSPELARQLLRTHDRMFINEWHPEPHAALKQHFASDPRVILYGEDGFSWLKAVLPPKERRACILIDPPYEATNEFEQVIQSLRESLKRFATGIYAVWYPLKSKPAVQRFYRQLTTLDVDNILIAELQLGTAFITEKDLSGCGLAVLNPPWQVEHVFHPILVFLLEVLARDKAATQKLFWLKHENV